MLTRILLETIYPHVNYLTIITGKKELYEKRSHEIFIDSGLNLQVLGYNKNIIASADIIINTGVEFNFAYAIKYGALYLGLNDQKNYLNDLKIKRPDVFIFNKLNLYYENQLTDNVILEMVLFCLDDDFKKILSGSYDQEKFISVREHIRNLRIKVSSFQKSV